MLFGYNGNPYITLKLALLALKTHNNIIFFSKKYYAINTLITQTLNKVCKKQNYADEICMIEYENIDEIITNQSCFDLLLYIGDKREYQNIKSKMKIPTIFNGYNYVDVFVESKDYKNLLLDINKYSNENDISINYFDNTSYEETLDFINKYELSDCFVLLSKNTDNIYKFMSQIKVNRFYINKNPFVNYDIDIDEKSLIYNKNIYIDG